MTYQVKLTTYAKGEIESAYLWHKRYNSSYADSWFRGLMNTIATLQEKPLRCALARENDDFAKEIRQLIYGKGGNRYRIIFIVEDYLIYILSVRHGNRNYLDFNPLNLE